MTAVIEHLKAGKPHDGLRVPLGEVAEFINGAAFKPTDWEGEGRRIIRIQNLNDSTKPFNRTTKDVPEKLKVHPGDLLVSWSASLGVFTWKNDDIAVLNQHIFRVVPDESRVIKAYLRHMLIGALVDMEEHLHGATMKHVNRGEFLDTQIPLPPLDEQRRIAAILDKADELRTKRRQAIVQLHALTQSIFQSIFGDLTNERHIPLRDAVAPGTIVTYGIVQAGDEYPSGVPYVRTGDIRNGRIHHEGLRRTNPAIAAKFARSRIAAGDIVMSIRATVGTVALTPQELDGANLTQGTARIAPGPETEASYLLEYLRTPRIQQWIQKQVKGATFKEITLDRLRQLPVSIPRRADQLSFGHAVSAVEKLKGHHRAQLSDLEILFASLQHRAFKGEL